MLQEVTNQTDLLERLSSESECAQQRCRTKNETNESANHTPFD